MAIKDLTIIHSNDMHGHFLGKKDRNGHLSGSLAQVSGYVNRAKAADPNAIYINAGDVFQGSLIDSDWQGLSTATILNELDMDIMALGNHELDYGISHLLFIDKCTDTTIVNTNFKVKGKDVHLFKPYHVMEINGLNVLFLGILTKNIVDQTKTQGLVGDLVEICSTPKEMKKVYQRLERKGKHIDLTVLVTHIGYEADLKLARSLGPEMHVDIIVGAHSHTYLEKPVVENGIIILQAGMENTHIGHLAIKYDTDKKKIVNYDYQFVPVDEEHCPTDPMMKAMVATYAFDVDQKYSSIVTRFARRIDNNGRNNPTELGQLYADAFKDSLPGIDAFLLASSSTRCYYMDMTVSLQDLRESYPYDGKLYKFTVDGKMLREMLTHALRDEVIINIGETMYQTSRDIHIRYSKADHEIKELTINGQPVRDDEQYTLGMQEFYFDNADIGFGKTRDEMTKYGEPKTISSDAFQTLLDYMTEHSNIGGPIDNRLIIED